MKSFVPGVGANRSLKSALTPSGIITARAVPTSNPAPNTVTFFSLSCNSMVDFKTIGRRNETYGPISEI